MITHDLVQGSLEWHAHRAGCFNASDAPAMLGCSPYQTRADLLRAMATGVRPEVDAGTQKRFDDGHRFERLARELAQKILGEALFPVTGSNRASGLVHDLSASFDGITTMDDVAFEHKTLNNELRALFDQYGEHMDGSHLPLLYRAQMEQQAMVCDSVERILFMASRWTESDELVEERHCWYEPDAELRRAILAGWVEFERDLAAWQPEDTSPKAVGRTMGNLPALRIEATGSITASNLSEFKEHALACIRGVNRELKTDQDFADAEAAMKWCERVEASMEAAEEALLAQTADVATAVQTLRDLGAEARHVRIALKKDVTAQKDDIKAKIVAEFQQRVRDHIAAINAELPKPWVAVAMPDFAGAMKNRRTIDTLREACAAPLVSATAQANFAGASYLANHMAMGEHAHLFPDFAAVGCKLPDDFAALLQLRIHQAAEAERVKKEARARQLRQSADSIRALLDLAAGGLALGQIDAEIRRVEDAGEADWGELTAEVAPLLQAARDHLVGLRRALTAPKPVAAPQAVQQVAPAAPAAQPGALCTLGALEARLGVPVTAALLERLGFPFTQRGASRMYPVDQYQAIVDALIKHLQSRRDELPMAA